jgi:hypothetical protein
MITAIESCLVNENTFLVIDCPSGTGKTLAGVALSLLDNRQNHEASIAPAPASQSFLGRTESDNLDGPSPHRGSPARLSSPARAPLPSPPRQTDAPPNPLTGGAPVAVVHLIWPKAVDCQRIYQEIVKQNGVNKIFFEKASAFDYVMLNSIEDQNEKELYVKKHLLSVLFPEMNSISHGACVVIIDEVPEDTMDVKHLGEIRDALKLVKNLCLVLSRTTSKASNMIGLSQGVATSGNNDDPFLWAMILTRLPRFVLQSSSVLKK